MLVLSSQQYAVIRDTLSTTRLKWKWFSFQMLYTELDQREFGLGAVIKSLVETYRITAMKHLEKLLVALEEGAGSLSCKSCNSTIENASKSGDWKYCSRNCYESGESFLQNTAIDVEKFYFTEDERQLIANLDLKSHNKLPFLLRTVKAKLGSSSYIRLKSLCNFLKLNLQGFKTVYELLTTTRRFPLCYRCGRSIINIQASGKLGVKCNCKADSPVSQDKVIDLPTNFFSYLSNQPDKTNLKVWLSKPLQDFPTETSTLYRFLKSKGFNLTTAKLLLEGRVKEGCFPHCLVCNIPVLKPDDANTGLRRYCSGTCANICPLNRETQRENRRKKYGADSMFASEYFKQQRMQKNTKLIQARAKEADLMLIGDFTATKDEHDILCLKCNNIFKDCFINMKVPYCPFCAPKLRSTIERKIQAVLEETGIPFQTNTRPVIKTQELDFYIPSHSIAIEANGLFWHSANHTDYVNIHRNKHIRKLHTCREHNVRLLQFSETDINEKLPIVRSIIRTALSRVDIKIFARKCRIELISNAKTREFLTLNHIQGSTPSTVNIGLYYEDSLVQVMTLGKSRFKRDYEFELLRLCSRINTVVVGGSSKLFNYFKANYLEYNQRVLSYCDLSKYTGTVYAQLGFKFLRETKPNYVYLDRNSRPAGSRMSFQKHKLPKLLKVFDPNLTELENMFANNYRVMWDCGNGVWEYTKTSDEMRMIQLE